MEPTRSLFQIMQSIAYSKIKDQQFTLTANFQFNFVSTDLKPATPKVVRKVRLVVSEDEKELSSSSL